MCASLLATRSLAPQPAPRTAYRGYHRVGIVGIGNSGRALAAWLAHQGHQVHLLTRDLARLPRLSRERSLSATDRLQGTFKLMDVTDCPGRFASQSRIIFVTTVATVYREVARRLAPTLTREHSVVLFSSKLGGSLEMQQALKREGVVDIRVGETDALFACRSEQDNTVWIRGIKQWNLFAAPTATESRRLLSTFQEFFPRVDGAANLVERGLTDFGAMAHPVIMLANMNAVDRSLPFLFYMEGLTPRTVRLLEAVAAEFRAVGRAYDASVPTIPELLQAYYGGDGNSALSAMHGVPNYRVSQAPLELEHRYLWEDVSCTLVPLQGLARKAGVATPMVDAVITQASILLDRDLRTEGRTLERLGWAHLSHGEILASMAR